MLNKASGSAKYSGSATTTIRAAVESLTCASSKDKTSETGTSHPRKYLGHPVGLYCLPCSLSHCVVTLKRQKLQQVSHRAATTSWQQSRQLRPFCSVQSVSYVTIFLQRRKEDWTQLRTYPSLCVRHRSLFTGKTAPFRGNFNLKMF